jgi:hypothetical protein
MIEQCRLHNKTLIFESATNKSFNLQKRMINSFIEHSIKDGVDCILIKEELSNDDSYIETIKIINSSITQMELSNDNKENNQEISK